MDIANVVGSPEQQRDLEANSPWINTEFGGTYEPQI